MNVRRAGACGAVVMGVLLAGCANPDAMIDTRLIGVSGDRASRDLVLSIASCGAREVRTDVDPAADRVLILVRTVGGHDGAECAETTTVRLTDPLGSRRVIDLVSRREVPVQPAGG